MKLQNLSVKRLFGRVAMGLVLSMSGITIALFLVTKQTAVLLTGGALLLCALVGIAARLRLPPQTVARAFCRASIGPVSHLPVLRLAPVKEERNNCPFLTEDHCAIHDAEPLVCALYPLAQEISREGEVRYFLQPTGCGGTVFAARVEDYLARYDVPAREKTDVRWAQTCMELEDVVEPLDAALEPPLRRRMQAKLWQALYFRFDYGQAYLPQLEANLVWLDEALQKLTEYQQRRNTYRKK